MCLEVMNLKCFSSDNIMRIRIILILFCDRVEKRVQRDHVAV